MRDQVLALYHRLPAPARSAAATLRGLYLHLWRYGPESDRLARQTLEHDTWSLDQWRLWREEALGRVLHRAATRVPYYRDLWEKRRRHGDRASHELLENWPVLEKDVLRNNARAFVADDCNIRRMFREQTSGTTGKPLEIWRTRKTVEALYAITGARTDRWHGIPRDARWARLGGQLVIPVSQRRPPFWVWNAVMRQLYLSTYHLAPDLIPHYLDALVRYRVVYLAGYTSSLVAIAHEVLRSGRDDLEMLAVFTNAEPLHAEQRDIISRAFRCPVRETYGMTETVAAASECQAGRLHLFPEVGHVEVWSDGHRAPDGESGEFLCTGILNPDMPLIRYRVGDRGSLLSASKQCECGRTLPLVGSIDGRSTDLLLTRDGRSIFWLNPVFYGLPVRQSQIVQESLDRLTVRVDPAPGFGHGTERTIVERLRSRMGDVDVVLECVPEIPRTPNGKLQAVVCRVPPSEREAVLRGAPRATSAAVR
jgi:phenylacetate-CoA ligase